MNKCVLKLSLLSLFLILSCVNNKDFSSHKTDIYSKVDSIMNLMTLREKIGQMTMYSGDWDKTGPTISLDNIKLLIDGEMGAMLNVYSAKKTKELQKIATEETRLGIPLLFGYDVIHGFKTIFPINLGHAASWDIEDIQKTARIAAEEASAVLAGLAEVTTVLCGGLVRLSYVRALSSYYCMYNINRIKVRS